MKSIRVFLVTAILAVVTLFSFISALRGYETSLQEVERMFDGQLAEKAKLIANINIQGTARSVGSSSSTAFQIWQGNNLIGSSDNASKTALGKLQPGFSYQNFEGYRWRTYSYYNNTNAQWIIVAARQDIRFSLAENVALKAVLPAVIGLPILALLIWVVVSRGLHPMRRLAQELSSKQADDLGPLSIAVNIQELAQIISSSNDLLARLKSSLLREKQFASDAAHELRTPISSLKVQLHNIAQEQPERNEEFGELQKITNQLEHVVEQILALYRTSPDEYHTRFEAIDLTNLAQQVIAEEYDNYERKNQQIEFFGQSQLILGDKFSLTTLIQNLLSNANKYTPNGGHIMVKIRRENDQVVLLVEDSGPGIPAHEHERLFQRFYRVGGDRHTSGESGCGLGLAIVKRIAELYHAEITLEPSSFASGTAFTLRFSAITPVTLDSKQS